MSLLQKNRCYKTYKDSSPEVAANTAVCFIHQTNYLLDRQLRVLEKEFLKEGGFTERMYIVPVHGLVIGIKKNDLHRRRPYPPLRPPAPAFL